MRPVLPWRVGVLAGALLLAAVPPAAAGVRLPEPPLPQRVALAECVVVGRVAALAADPVGAYPLLKVAGAPKVPYQVAEVEVETVVAGARGARRLRVGFIVPLTPERGGPTRPRRPAVKLTAGQEGCFFLRKHPDEPFYVVQSPWDLLAKGKDFDKDLALIKRCVRILDDPDAGLRSRDAGDRLLTAAMLIFRYRTVLWVYPGPPRTEPIDAEQSRLILATLSEGPWTDDDAKSPTGRLRLFLRLDLTRQDGWQSPRSVAELAPAAEKWLRENRATYRIRRYVPVP
jgi:hypothetical protein